MNLIGRSLQCKLGESKMTMFSRFMNDESGATAIEYGLIAAIVGVGIILGLGNLKTELNNTMNKVQSELKAGAAAN